MCVYVRSRASLTEHWSHDDWSTLTGVRRPRSNGTVVGVFRRSSIIEAGFVGARSIVTRLAFDPRSVGRSSVDSRRGIPCSIDSAVAVRSWIDCLRGVRSWVDCLRGVWSSIDGNPGIRQFGRRYSAVQPRYRYSQYNAVGPTN